MPRNRSITAAVVLVAVLLATAGVAAVGGAQPTATPATTGGVGVAQQAGNGTAQANQTATSGQANRTGGVTTITVAATGQVQADPDSVVVQVSSVAVAADPANATSQLAANVSKLRGALLAANVSRDGIQTTGFTVFQRQPRPNASVEYVAQQSLSITLNDTSRAGEIVDVAISNGATTVDGVSFTLSPDAQRALRQQALRQAVSHARQDADTVAEAAGLSISGVRAVSVGNGGVSPFERQVAAAAPPGTEIEPAPITVTASVTVTYNATG